MKSKVEKLVNQMMDELIKLSEYIYKNPELGNEEFKASKAHCDILKSHGFKIEKGYLGIKTAFRAEYEGKKPGPNIAYLAEYDALPKIGHGCGHNLLGTVSTGAGIVLSKFVDEIGGKVTVLGTPAEETNGAKVTMAKKETFKDIDIALIAHPADNYYKSGTSCALEPIQFTFKGKSAHAAASPEEGINALDAVIMTFNAINALREHIKSSAKIHGIIKEGGKAANIVPDLAIAQFYVRADTKEYVEELSKKVKKCAEGAAIATGAKLEIEKYEFSNDNLITNNALHEIFIDNLKKVGIENIKEPPSSSGSTDVGNVSHVCPTIQPHFGICKEGVKCPTHTLEFAKATLTDEAYFNMGKTISALVLTGIDIISDNNLLCKIKKEHKENTNPTK